MTAQELATGLEATGYPVVYRQWKQAQNPPYIVYLFVESADLMADNENYLPAGDYHVELYTDDKDPTAEASVENELRALGLPWSKLETWIEAEAMNQVLYTVRIIETREVVS